MWFKMAGRMTKYHNDYFSWIDVCVNVTATRAAKIHSSFRTFRKKVVLNSTFSQPTTNNRMCVMRQGQKGTVICQDNEKTTACVRIILTELDIWVLLNIYMVKLCSCLWLVTYIPNVFIFPKGVMFTWECYYNVFKNTMTVGAFVLCIA